MPPLSEGQLRLGRLFESEFERQAHNRGYHVVKHCEQLGVQGTKAPMLTGRWKGFRLPDFTILANRASYWVEAKYKSYSPYYGITGDRRQGIDLPNWRDYLRVCELSGQRGFLIIGVGKTGDIIVASFEHLRAHAQIHDKTTQDFPDGGVFWPASIFSPWGSFDLPTGQMRFDFGKGFVTASPKETWDEMWRRPFAGTDAERGK